MPESVRDETDRDDPLERVRHVLDAHFEAAPPRDVLDAGCGFDSAWSGFPTPAAFASARVVGVDISRDELEKNQRLDERIVGDIQTYPLPEQSFDAIVCWNVLEHLREPQLALANLVRALRPDGLLVLSLPNVLSPKGLITKFTPFWFHVWVYRRFFGVAEAGQPGHGPYRTYLRFALRPRGLRRLAAAHALEVVHFELYGQGIESLGLPPSRIVRALLAVLFAAYRGLTLGRADPELSEIAAILRRRPA